MLRSTLQGVARLATGLQGSLAPAALSTVHLSRSAAGKAAGTEDIDIETRDAYTFLAKQMQAEAGKSQAPLKQDVLKIIDLLEDASPDADAPYEGKLKDALKFMGKTSKNMLFKTLMEEEEMKNMHPALKNVMGKLAEVGQSASIVEVVYKYIELTEGKGGESTTTVEMTLASEESAAEVESKKAMLLHDMITKGKIASGDPVSWRVKVDPSIEGGVVYNLGDVLVDCSVKSLKDEFYESLASSGIQRVE